LWSSCLKEASRRIAGWRSRQRWSRHNRKLQCCREPKLGLTASRDVCRELPTWFTLNTTHMASHQYAVSRKIGLMTDNKHTMSVAMCREPVYQAHDKENNTQWWPSSSRPLAWTVTFVLSLMPRSRQRERHTVHVMLLPWASSTTHGKHVAATWQRNATAWHRLPWARGRSR
jgi:hypothetical protein